MGVLVTIYVHVASERLVDISLRVGIRYCLIYIPLECIQRSVISRMVYVGTGGGKRSE